MADFPQQCLAVVIALLTCLIEVKVTGAWDEDSSNQIVHPVYYDQRVLTVTTILLEPYTMIRPHNQTIRGQTFHLYEGYIVDLLDRISEIVGFRYRLVPVWDGQFGYKRQDGVWDGMIGELTKGKADIAAGPMFVTEQRRHVVDFSRPFMTVRASLLLRRPADGKGTPVTSLDDLAKRTDMRYGTLNRGLIRKAFRTAASNRTLYKLMWESMKKDENEVLTKSNQEGIQRVRDEDNYVFVLPGNIADYIVRRKPCDLISVNSFLLEESMALAVPVGSTLRPYLNRALDALDRTRVLHRLYQKWWIDRGQCGHSNPSKMLSPDTSSAVTPLHSPGGAWMLTFLAVQSLSQLLFSAFSS